MKIGIFLGYGPQTKMGKEGLGRYLAGLMKGFQEEQHELTIACPHWLMDTLDDLLNSFSIDKERIQYISPKKNPLIWEIFSLLTHQRKGGKQRFKRMLIRLQRIVKAVIDKTMKVIAETSNPFVFAAIMLLYVAVGLVLAIPLLILLLPLLGVAVLVLAWKFRNKIEAKFGGGLRKIVEMIVNLPVCQKTKQIVNPLRVFQLMNDAVNRELVGMINARADDVDCWFVPSVFWPIVNEIHNTVIINAPDMVTQEYPQGFADGFNIEFATANCRKTIEHGRYFITYSEHLRRTLVMEQYGKSPEYVAAIPHVNNDMASYIEIDRKLNAQLNTDADFSEKFARSLLMGLNPAGCTPGYEAGARWDKMHYIFYASQVRPSKNMLTLLRAYEYLLRKRFIGHKLFLTAHPTANKQLNKFIKKHHLENDVVCFYNVSAQALAALYRCADLVVNPTLYEGGFPFTFGEGMSVGTPSLMSHIPQVEDVFGPAGLDEFMFDPYDWKNMAEKIEYWLPRTEELYNIQKPLYDELAKRTPDVVAKEYVEVFRRFIHADQGVVA